MLLWNLLYTSWIHCPVYPHTSITWKFTLIIHFSDVRWQVIRAPKFNQSYLSNFWHEVSQPKINTQDEYCFRRYDLYVPRLFYTNFQHQLWTWFYDGDFQSVIN